MEESTGYRFFKSYIRFLFEYWYFKKIEYIDRQNIPAHSPLMVVSNHQNGVFDPLALLMAIRNRKARKIRCVVRGDVFNMSGLKRITRWTGLLPAYRIQYEGAASLAENSSTFEEIENELLKDGTIILFPEAGHQDIRWLGKFSLAYLRMLFGAAERSGFEKEMYILPACNHYSDYYGARRQMLVRFGTPIPLSPYYQLYQEKPWTAQRQVNQIVRQQINDIMLNITDTDHYRAIDHIRNTYGIGYAEAHHYRPGRLSEKLTADRQLTAQLAAAAETHPDAVKAIYEKANLLDEQYRQLHLRDEDGSSSAGKSIFTAAALAALFLPYIIALLINTLIFAFPPLINRKIKDRMLHGTIHFAASALITLPFTCLLVFCLMYTLTGYWLIALACLPFIPLTSIFAIAYCRAGQRLARQWRFRCLLKRRKRHETLNLRKQLFTDLDKLLNINR
ncbi:MAG: 1-acyl-sn-glycerol-3-phosphate acyltransferase [Bacteroidales bacterium]|jgi:1-acyl-sn-glycerol-3-phosphate acyltransferase|nr:1-acyl-sn-glycerol-3-phosphate acyltransferase [Bacteroidales bacterium]